MPTEHVSHTSRPAPRDTGARLPRRPPRGGPPGLPPCDRTASERPAPARPALRAHTLPGRGTVPKDTCLKKHNSSFAKTKDEWGKGRDLPATGRSQTFHTCRHLGAEVRPVAASPGRPQGKSAACEQPAGESVRASGSLAQLSPARLEPPRLLARVPQVLRVIACGSPPSTASSG